MNKSMQIALIEDDMDLARLTRLLLESEGYSVALCHEGKSAIAFIRDIQPDLVLLDILLPDKNGIEICKAVRDFYQGPILMLTGCDDDMNEILAFQQGADDFITKPIKPPILLARIKAILNRSAIKSHKSEEIVINDLALSLSARSVHFQRQPVSLTTSEFDLLALLAKHTGCLVTREECCEQLRGFSYDGFDRSIDMHISALRKKLKHTPLHIITVRGKGYQLSEQTC